MIAAARARGDFSAEHAVGGKDGPEYARLVGVIVAKAQREHQRRRSDEAQLEALAGLEQSLASEQRQRAAFDMIDWYPEGAGPPEVEEARRQRAELQRRALASAVETARWRPPVGPGGGNPAA